MQTIAILLTLTLLAVGCASEVSYAERSCSGADVAEPCPKQLCESFGYCTRNAAACCVAVLDSDCKTSDRCTEYGYCVARGGVCVDGAS